MKFHHIGIPTTQKRENETYLEGAKLYISDIDQSPYKIEWLRFEEGSPMPELIQTTAHVAFVVEDMDKALEGQEVLMPPFTPMEGLTVAFVISDGAPVELMQLA